MSRKRKKWLSRMLALCLILALLPINTAYADEVDTQDAVYQTEDIQPAEAAAQPEVQAEEVKPEEMKPEAKPEEAQPETQPEEVKPEEQPEEVKPEAQPEEVKPEEQPAEVQPEEVKPEEVQPEEAQPEEAQPEETQPEEVQPAEAQPEEVQPAEAQPEVQPEAPVEPDQGAAVEETAEPAEIMLAPAAVSPAASYEILTEIELNFKPVTEITTLDDFKQVTYSPSDKIFLKSVDVREGYQSTTGPTPGIYISDHAYTVMYEFKCKSDAYIILLLK